MAAGRGLLDTSTVILLARLRDPSVLPDEPMISTVTLAELSVGPLLAHGDSIGAARSAPNFSARKRTSSPCLSMRTRPGPLVRSRLRFEGLVARRWRGRTTP
jgi:hypothetical protein